MYPEVGTLVTGVGNEVIVSLVSAVVVLASSYLVVKVLLADTSRQALHPDTFSTVQSTRREMGVARETGEPTATENCPVCLGRVEHCVETNCGHKFCANCILEYWRHDQWPHPARCPVCRRVVTLLLGSILEADEVRAQVLDYNQRMSGEWRPMWSYLQDVPTVLKHLWRELFSERGPFLVRKLYLGYALILLVIYLLSPFDIIPESIFGVLGYIDDVMLVLIAAVYMSFLYRAVLVER